MGFASHNSLPLEIYPHVNIFDEPGQSAACILHVALEQVKLHFRCLLSQLQWLMVACLNWKSSASYNVDN